MAKLGDAYQEAVADVARSLDPDAQIEVGTWVEGPDGRRDFDVAVRPSANGAPRLILIECKDWGRPVGIAAIDALESKRRDLSASVAIICSNSGFTADALRKASRVDIPALSALIEGDSRIRVEAQEEIYTRKTKVTRCDSTWHFLVPNAREIIPAGTSAGDLVHNDRLVAAWIRDKCMSFAAMATHSRTLVAKYRFRRPIQLHVMHVVLPANGVDLKLSFAVQWCSQVVQIGASSGMYDYLRKRVIFGQGNQQYLLKNVDFDKWTPVDEVPPQLLTTPSTTEGKMLVSLGLISGLDMYGEAPAPDLDSLVETQHVTDEVPEVADGSENAK